MSHPKVQRVQVGAVISKLAEKNKNSVDWSWSNLIAYGSQNEVYVVEPTQLKVIQTIHHSNLVSKVKWVHDNFHHTLGSPYNLRLISVTSDGSLHSWDIGEGNLIAKFNELGKNVEDMQWLHFEDTSKDLLLVLHSSNTFVLWNIVTGIPLWKKSYSSPERLRQFSIDPFQQQRIAALSGGLLLLVSDITITDAPREDFVWLNFQKSSSNPNSSSVALTKLHDLKSPSRSSLQCLQVKFFPSIRDHVIALFPRDVIIFVLEYLNCVTSVSTDIIGSDFYQVFPCSLGGAFYCLHTNGILSFFKGNLQIKTNADSDDDVSMETTQSYVTLHRVCSSDSMRISSKALLYGASLSPSSETEMCVIQSNGHVFLWKLHQSENLNSGIEDKMYLSDVIPSLNSNEQKKTVNFRFHLSSFMSGCSPEVTCVRSCPPLTHRNWPYYRPLVAMGCRNGMINVVDLSSSHQLRSFTIHSHDVRGIEWLSSNTIVSFANSTSLESDQSRSNDSCHNEVYVTDIESGQSSSVDTKKLSSIPISFIRVSHLKQYMIIGFRDVAIQVWDAHQISLLREIVKETNFITSLEWAPFNTSKSTGRLQGARVKEHLVFTDGSGMMFHCIAEGSSFRQGSNIPFSMGGMGKGGNNLLVTATCWKADILFMGRSDGFLTVWDLNEKVSRSLISNHSVVRKSRFGPGKGNMKVLVLFTNSVEIWDAVQLQCLFRPLHRENCKILDVDWCASDKLVVLLDGGAGVYVIEMTSQKIQQSTSIMSKAEDMTSYSVELLPRLWQTKVSFDFKFKILNGHFDEILDFENSDVEVCEELKKLDTLGRCKVVSRLYGDQSDSLFWSHVSKAVNHEISAQKSDEYNDLSLDVFCHRILYKLVVGARINYHHPFIEGDSQIQKSIRNFIELGQTKKAIDILLMTSPTNPRFYENSLKAALLASLNDVTVTSRSTLKLIATNLIAAGNVEGGCELLCVIDKCQDACMYLRDSLLWDRAIGLAKLRLEPEEIKKVLEPWTKHLLVPKINKKYLAIYILLSMGKFKSAIEVLHQMRHYDRAAILSTICKERDIEVGNESQLDEYQSNYEMFLSSFVL